MSDDEATGEPMGAAAPPDASAPARPTHDASGMARPRFILDFPADEQLEQLVAAFERGDYATVRDQAERLAEQTDRNDVRDAARELRRRVDPDPLARFVVIASILLLLFLVVWTYAGHDH